MHVPDGVIGAPVSLAAGAVSAAALGFALWKLRDQKRERTVARIGMTAAFVFAAQMVNFQLYPLPISGHLMGGVLAAVMVGPWGGAVVIACVLLVQCLLFGDGGITALGVNYLNMGVIGSLCGYAIYAPLRSLIGGKRGTLIAAMAASWFSLILAAGAFGLEFGASGHRREFFQVLGLMVLVHSAIGLGEALITGGVLRFVLLTSPEILEGAPGSPQERRPHWSRAVLAGLIIALAVAVFLAPLKSNHADGLEWVGAKTATIAEDAPAVVRAPFPDYTFPYLSGAGAAAGALGTVAVFVLGAILARAFVGATRAPAESPQHAA